MKPQKRLKKILKFIVNLSLKINLDVPIHVTGKKNERLAERRNSS
jgi:hypothetical protein